MRVGVKIVNRVRARGRMRLRDRGKGRVSGKGRAGWGSAPRCKKAVGVLVAVVGL